ncbi:MULTISPECIES: hypothetical protein [Enterococcus]|uniref:hypothetical protein n=1 Tax=Enterococcus TaxID=1350 RepID=UPI0011A9E44F|nr:hypothetical protein [Enterococcus casseliflavus]
MALYAITYDLHKPIQDYETLHDTIKSLGAYSKRFDSFWLIDTSFSASEIRDKINNVIDSNDVALVIEVRKHWASHNLPKEAVDWLKSDKRTFN